MLVIRRNTSKPNENDDTPGTSWEGADDLLGDYMKRSKTVVSEITGGEMTKWDEEIDAGCVLLLFMSSYTVTDPVVLLQVRERQLDGGGALAYVLLRGHES